MKSKKEEVFSVEKPEQSTGFLLWQVTNLWQREIKKALIDYDLTHSQFVLMASILWLEASEKNISQILLSQFTKIDAMTTSTVLRTLQKKGYIKRKEDNLDTRAKKIVLTDKGREVTKKAVVSVEKFDYDFFSALGIEVSFFNQSLNTLLPQ